MMKIIQIIETAVIPNVSNPPGIYLCMNMLYLAQGSGIPPMAYPIGQIKLMDAPSPSSENSISEDFIMKLLAVGNDPKRVHDFTKT